MKILEARQGTPDWHRLRAEHYRTASRASAMMGASPYQSRQALLTEIKTGLAPEIDPDTQRRFDRGHAIEELARPQAEQIIGEDLYPVTTLTDDEYLLASFDGATMLGEVVWECKTYSKAKADEMAETGQVPAADRWQVVQQLVVSGAEKCLYMLHDGAEKMAYCWAKLDPKDAEKLRAGWAQFDADLEVHEVKAAVPEAIGASIESLPALRIELTGSVIASNLDMYRDAAIERFRSLNTDLQTDQDFADAEQAVKFCKDIEDRLSAAKDAALGQTADIDALFRSIDQIASEARSKRLELDKLVKARKEARRLEIVQQAREQIEDRYSRISESLGLTLAAPRSFQSDVAAEMKGKRTISSLLEAADKVLTRAKLDANALADRVRACQAVMIAEAGDHKHLFVDANELVLTKQPDDLRNLVKARIAEAEAREQARIKEAEERAAAKARAEEQAKAEAARQEAERAARQQQAAQAPKQPSEPRSPEAAQPQPQPQIARETNARESTQCPPICLRDINEAIAPLTITQAGLAAIGIEAVGREKSAVLYSAGDFEAICSRLIGVLHAAAIKPHKEAA